MSNIKFKAIELGMVIHCPTEENAKELLKHLDELGYVWTGDKSSLLDKVYYQSYRENTCYETEENGIVFFGSKDFFEKEGYTITEFSDLVEPDMSAEEVLRILGEIKRECIREYDDLKGCVPCPLNIGNTGAGHVSCKMEDFIGNEQRIIEICQQWKAQHEKKEPEIETVDICRIIEILPDDRKRCVYEEDIKSEQVPCGSERIAVEEILKRYCMEHDGEFRAVHETISRVKKS